MEKKIIQNMLHLPPQPLYYPSHVSILCHRRALAHQVFWDRILASNAEVRWGRWGEELTMLPISRETFKHNFLKNHFSPRPQKRCVLISIFKWNNGREEKWEKGMDFPKPG